MSAGNFRLPLHLAADLAAKIAADLAPCCERVEIAGSIRRQRPDIGDIELVVIPKFARSLLDDVPGASFLDMHLVSLMARRKLLRAWSENTQMESLTCRDFYVGSLFNERKLFKVQINISNADRWPVELAIKTGPAEFSHRLVCHSDNPARGFLPHGWRIGDGWQVFDAKGERVLFESERQFIETFCGAWVPPERR
jgi:DNA polymerase/3'-5' exonuclease PolX